MVPHQHHSVHNRLILHDMAVTWHHTNSIHQYALYVTWQTYDTPTSYRSVGWPTRPVWSTQCCWRCCWRQWSCGSYWCTMGGCTVCCSSICPGCHWRSATVGAGHSGHVTNKWNHVTSKWNHMISEWGYVTTKRDHVTIKWGHVTYCTCW